MPHKNKKDRNEAVRRYRSKKKDIKERIEAAERIQKTISQISLPFNSDY